MNSVRAQYQLLCDLAVAQPPSDARNDLPLTTGKQDRLGFAHVVRRHMPRCQRFAARADDGVDISMPREVCAALQRNERRAWNRGRDLTPQPVWHRTVVARMHNQRRPADQGKSRAYIEAVDET